MHYYSMADVEKMKIGEIMDRKLVAVAPMTTIRAAAKLISTAHVDTLPVVEDGKLTGIIYDEDVLGYSVDHDEEEMAALPIEQLVKPAIFVELGTSVKDTIKLATREKITRIPVVENRKNMHCVGVISATELLKEITKADKFKRMNL